MINITVISNDNKFYEIRPTGTHPKTGDVVYFLQSEKGQGMGMSGQQLFDMIDKYFKENFLKRVFNDVLV